MAFWDADFTTRMGAESATDQAGLACFIMGGLTVLGAIVFGGGVGFDTTEGQFIVAAIGIQAVFAVIAGFRFRAGKGAFVGIAVAALMAFEIVNKLIAVLIGVGLVINVIILIMIIQGIRGAFALRKGEFDEDYLEAFE